MKDILIGRKTEIALLEKISNAEKSAFVAVYGRRRIGKTFLIRKTLDDKFTFQVTGSTNSNLKYQLLNFHSALQKYFPIMDTKPPAKNWFEAFQQLIRCLEQSGEGRKVVFLDELPWMDTPQSFFMSALEHFWNSWASARSDVMLIVCGSAASWMIGNLLNNRGGLHNRITHRINLEPFTLNETEAFLKQNAGVFDRYQIAQLYMILGGIPFYLEQIETGESVTQNIDRLCFRPNAPLRQEFDNLYGSLFKKSERHIAVIETLAKKLKGLSRNELIKLAKLPEGGGATKILKELEESNFIRKYREFGKFQKNMLYQLTDFFSIFYLKFMTDHNLEDRNTWLNSLDNPQIRAWNGFAFERLCLMHTDCIKKALGIAGVQTQTSAWLGVSDSQKAQVDLVIDRRDRVINLCEMKFSIKKFAINKQYAEELRTKIGLFKEITETNKSVYLTFITTFGLETNEYAAALVQNSLTMDVLFEVI
jgi:AAA+ ATPase superfamily predicted ATPase